MTSASTDAFFGSGCVGVDTWPITWEAAGYASVTEMTVVGAGVVDSCRVVAAVEGAALVGAIDGDLPAPLVT
jgi:hypothetical protein